MNPLLIGPIIDMAGKFFDKYVPDPAKAAEAKLKFLEMQQNGEFKDSQVRMSAIMAEAQSADPWTSRARPTFLYVFYAIILFMVMVAPMVGVLYPDQMDLFFLNVSKGFGAIPEELWWTFSVGYLGYSGARTFEKRKGLAK